jgi:hypothetical protein
MKINHIYVSLMSERLEQEYFFFRVILIVTVLFSCVLLIYWFVGKYREHTASKRLIRQLHDQLNRYVAQMRQEYPQDIRVQRLCDRYRFTKMFESKTTQTYTLNKADIVMCVKDYSKNQTIHDDFNLLMFVALHELAHIMSETNHHTDEFWDNFKFILRQAAKWNYYSPVDYHHNPVPYCDMIIYTNPMFDRRTVFDLADDLLDILTGKT